MMSQSSTQSEQFWKIDVIEQALRFPFLMYAILGLSAMNMASVSSDDPVACQVHYEMALQYQNASVTESHDPMRLSNHENSIALVGEWH